MVASPFFDPFKGAGKIMSASPRKVVWFLELDDGNIATATQELVSPILDNNQEVLNNSAGQRWGDGKVVASIPLDYYFDKIAPAKRAGDDAYIKRFLNDSDNRKFRTFGGRI